MKGRGAGSRERFWALRDVSFDVKQGETLGIVGRNGSGKSTLLRLIARTMRPTEGRVVIAGRVMPLLELGAGFHEELSGSDNVYLNASLLGVPHSVVEARYRDIVEFAELEHFMDTPIKHYSSGMYLRLGFAIGVHLDFDILLVDELLAVGDAEFQRKCVDRIRAVRDAGATILLVSHVAEQVATLCDRAVWLDGGRVCRFGPAKEVVAAYLESSAS
ncbi:MAG: ABC transporter ATP-binding protein [Chloroflexi bacterium]|nr:ABC transporter ATP-binding protein [Chloroflexota bacterium]